MSKPYQFGTVITLAILIPALFLGYTYFADAQAIEKIYAEVENINQINPKFTKADISFTLNITNPTTRDINKLSSTFDIFIQDNYVGTGSFSNFSIPAQTNKITLVSVTVDYGELADSVVDFIKNWASGQDTTLKIEGTMNAQVLFGLATASHSYTATST
jgi:LEA14-like dessication related protein